MEVIDSKTIYKTPQVNIIEVNVQGVLCQSGGITSMTVDEDGGEDFE